MDNKIQVRFVRKYVKFQELIRNIESELYSEVKSYVICTWYNHWTTVLLEDAISQHPKVIPTLKNKKGIDLFFDGQPFDLKITYLPKEYDYKKALKDPKSLAIWLYENQGAQRFGSDNRLFVILYDSKTPEDSWKLKRDINFIRTEITKFFNTEKVTRSDEIVFTFDNRTYSAVTKILFLIK